MAERIVVSIDALRNHKRDAVFVLRLGAAANALGAVIRAYHSLGNPSNDPPASEVATRRRELDRMQLAAIAVCYLKESLDLFDEERPWHLAAVARSKGHRTDLDLIAARRSFSE